MAVYTTAITDIGESLKFVLEGSKEYRIIPKEMVDSIYVNKRKDPWKGYILPLTPVGYTTGTPEIWFDVSTTLDGTTYTTIDLLTDAIESARKTGGGGGTGTDVNLKEVDGNTIDVGAGNAGSGTQRVSISTDDVNLAAIKTASESVATSITTNVTAIFTAGDATGDLNSTAIQIGGSGNAHFEFTPTSFNAAGLLTLQSSTTGSTFNTLLDSTGAAVTLDIESAQVSIDICGVTPGLYVRAFFEHQTNSAGTISGNALS